MRNVQFWKIQIIMISKNYLQLYDLIKNRLHPDAVNYILIDEV